MERKLISSSRLFTIFSFTVYLSSQFSIFLQLGWTVFYIINVDDFSSIKYVLPNSSKNKEKDVLGFPISLSQLVGRKAGSPRANISSRSLLPPNCPFRDKEINRKRTYLCPSSQCPFHLPLRKERHHWLWGKQLLFVQWTIFSFPWLQNVGKTQARREIEEEKEPLISE